MSCLFTTRLVNGPTGDPGLQCEMSGQRRSLLFDLGELVPLMPRELLRVSHAFVSHTHMDHFAGLDHLLRVILGRQSRLVLVGGPGFVAQVEHKLHADTWDLVLAFALEEKARVAVNVARMQAQPFSLLAALRGPRRRAARRGLRGLGWRPGLMPRVPDPARRWLRRRSASRYMNG